MLAPPPRPTVPQFHPQYGTWGMTTADTPQKALLVAFWVKFLCAPNLHGGARRSSGGRHERTHSRSVDAVDGSKRRLKNYRGLIETLPPRPFPGVSRPDAIKSPLTRAYVASSQPSACRRARLPMVPPPADSAFSRAFRGSSVTSALGALEGALVSASAEESSVGSVSDALTGSVRGREPRGSGRKATAFAPRAM
jgi:hypothetical protein